MTNGIRHLQIRFSPEFRSRPAGSPLQGECRRFDPVSTHLKSIRYEDLGTLCWEVLGTWASAVGTIGAVIVSLWLAGRQNRPRLLTLADKRILISGVPKGLRRSASETFPTCWWWKYRIPA
jgi:hypothetical protein